MPLKPGRKYVTKPGRHGTLYLYSFTLRDSDPGVCDYVHKSWGYSEEDAHERMVDSLYFQGWDYRRDYTIQRYNGRVTVLE